MVDYLYICFRFYSRFGVSFVAPLELHYKSRNNNSYFQIL
nr:MAG TPA: hypothetical protein [Caudoviricetes sp.]